MYTFKTFELWYVQRYLDLPKPLNDLWLVHTDYPQEKNDLQSYAQFLLIKEEFVDEIAQGHLTLIEGDFCEISIRFPEKFENLSDDYVQCLEKVQHCLDCMDFPEYWKAKYDELVLQKQEKTE